MRGKPLGPGVGAGDLVRAARGRYRGFHHRHHAGAFRPLGDVHDGIDEAVWSIEPLLDWADRDERDRGLGDAPYPPNFPKQEGEPPRVQPSRMNRANWTGAADEVERQQLT